MNLIPFSKEINCNRDEFSIGDRCCSKCPPGQGVRQMCSTLNDTICKQCDKGITFSSTHSRNDKCKDCTICDGNARVKYQCDVQHDTECECEVNYYFDSIKKFCRPCELCPIGYGLISECTSRKNTVCQICTNRTYKDHRASVACQQCTPCNVGQLTLRLCSHQENTVCVEIPEKIPKDALIAIEKMPPSDGNLNEDEYNGQYIPLYCSLLGLIIIGLIIYVITSHAKNKKAKQNANLNIIIEEDFVPEIKQGSDSGVGLENDARYGISQTRLKDLSVSKRRIIEIMLSDSLDGPGHWRILANEIGYGPRHIADFEYQSSIDPHCPCHFLFNDWMRKEKVTVGHLCKILKCMNRTDIIKEVYAPDGRTHVNQRNDEYEAIDLALL